MFEDLKGFLGRVPAVRVLGHQLHEDGSWHVKLTIDIDHKFAWHAVQELAFVLNYISLTERLPTVFKPVSPPPYLNGGPRDYLSWIIEAESSAAPRMIRQTLEGRMPRPVDDLSQWGDGDE